MTFLINVTEQYRCDSEEEAQQLIAKAKENHRYTVIKTSNTFKTAKLKGEVIDKWWRVTITKEFCTEKEPDCTLKPIYSEEYDED